MSPQSETTLKKLIFFQHNCTVQRLKKNSRQGLNLRPFIPELPALASELLLTTFPNLAEKIARPTGYKHQSLTVLPTLECSINCIG